MGRITTDLLETMRIRWSYLPDSISELVSVTDDADAYMAKESLPFAFVMRKGDIEPYNLNSIHNSRPVSLTVFDEANTCNLHKNCPTRNETLQSIQSIAGSKTAIIATTGFTGRELCLLDDRKNQLYLVGSMGCALSVGIGIALNKPELRVIVVDGDGALLMRTSAMGITSSCTPSNLIHILLDNEMHESTGGQSTLSRNVSFPLIAKGFGYTNIFSIDSLIEFESCLSKSMKLDGPIFIHLKIRQGTPDGLGRPSTMPVQVKDRFMKYLSDFQEKQ